MLALLALVACGGDPFGYPLDDVLRLQHVQVKGTHNSYHVAPPNPITEEWAYTHAPLEVQLEAQDVRQFELDTQFDPEAGAFAVYHAPLVDKGSNCGWLSDCLDALKGWSDANPAHLPLTVFIEPKTEFTVNDPVDFPLLEQTLLAAWPRERILTPDDLRGRADTVREVVVDEGWPTLGELRGKVIFLLLDSQEPFEQYTDGGATLDGRLMFANAPLDSDIAAMKLMDDAHDPGIADAVRAGFVIRTRADSGGPGDLERRDAALASGAQIVSTDYPAPVEGVDYVVELPDGGGAARCNPLTAPPECTSAAVEDLSR